MNSTYRIEEALRFIDPHDRDTWVKMGMAIKSKLGDSGFEIWERWSKQADSFNARDARDVWKSISQSGGVTIGTLFHEAKANGWRGGADYHTTSMEELNERQRITEERAAKDQAERDRERANTAAKAAEVWNASIEAQPDHPYLARKQVSPVTTLREIDAVKAAQILGYSPKCRGEPLSGRLLVVPVKQGDVLSTLELIDGDKRKSALAGQGTKACGYWATRQLPEGDGKGLTVLIGEGVATVLSASAATGQLGIAALSVGNLPAVAKAMRERYPAAVLVILADLVKANGLPEPHAIEAASIVAGKTAIPDFGSDRDPAMTDFNDMVQIYGAEAVAQAIAGATVLTCNAHAPGNDGAPAGDSEGDYWHDPQPLLAKLEFKPYPLKSLPPLIREAVEEVERFVKAPVSMVACSALSTVSLACQPHFDVRRREKLEGPVGLYILVIADSGERKSTCDGFFTKAISDYEEAQAEAAKPALIDHRAAIEAWEAKRAGVKEKIRQLARQQKSTADMESALRDLEQCKPEPPRTPRLLYADATPEALAYGLAKQWPSGGIVSAEAGIVFGSHGMGKDSVMRNLGLLNQLWDGKNLTIDRRSTDSFSVQGARLTISFQVQEPTLREFLSKSGPLPRGTGFIARFLVACPESTQGMRQIDPDAPDGPSSWPHLTAFNRRITAILAEPVPIDEGGRLIPKVLTMSSDGRDAWVAFHNEIEGQLSRGGHLYDVRDVASKSADNAARLAALFHWFEGAQGPICLASVERACEIVKWHLNEARRFLGELALPVELVDAAKLDGWLIEICRRDRANVVSKRDAQRGLIRDKNRLDAALRELEQLDRVKVDRDGHRIIIKVNPALVGGKP